MLAAACGVCRNFSGCIYSVILGQTIRRAFSFRHTAMQPVCMDRGHCSFGFYEKMGGYFQHIDKMDGSEIMGTLCIQNCRQCFFIFLWQQRDLPVHIWLMRSSAVFRCSGGSSVELEERKNNVCRKSHSASKTKSNVAG